jgi:hypothetical protein
VVELAPVVVIMPAPPVVVVPLAPPAPDVVGPPVVAAEREPEVNVDSLPFFAAHPHASAPTVASDQHERDKVGQDLMGASARTELDCRRPSRATRTKHGSENADLSIRAR